MNTFTLTLGALAFYWLFRGKKQSDVESVRGFAGPTKITPELGRIMYFDMIGDSIFAGSSQEEILAKYFQFLADNHIHNATEESWHRFKFSFPQLKDVKQDLRRVKIHGEQVFKNEDEAQRFFADVIYYEGGVPTSDMLDHWVEKGNIVRI